MKKILYFSAVISALFSFSACQKEIAPVEEPQEQLVTITFTADKVAETRTAANQGEEGVSYLWTPGDENNIKLFTVGTETVTNQNTGASYEQESLSEVPNPTVSIDYTTNKMTITASVAPNATYTFRAILCDPASYTSSGDDYGKRSPKIKVEQYPDGTDNFDPTADILVSEDMTVEVGPAEAGEETVTTGSQLMTFRRKVVINKMTLKNLVEGEKVVKVVITASPTGEGNGDIQGYLHNGSMTGQSNTITLKYNNGLTVGEGGQFPVYFVSMDNTDLALTVTVTTDQNTYSKSFAEGKSIDFNLGQFTRFGFALPDGVPLTALPDGDYFITGIKDSDTYAATAYVSGNNLSNPLVITVNNNDETINYVAGIEECVFTFTRIVNIENYLGKYTIQDANGLYLYAAGGNGQSPKNQLKGEASPDANGNAYWDVSKNSDGTYSIESAGDAARRIMRFNPTNTNSNGDPSPIFSCYATGQAPITLYPSSWCNIEASVATPTFTPAEGTYTSTQNVSISCATEGATIYYTTDGSDPTSSSTQYSTAIPISTTTTVKAIAKKNDVYSGIATATYTISSVIPETGWIETDLSNLTSNDIFVIVGVKGNISYAMSNDNGASSAPTAVAVTVNGTKLATDPADNLKWNLSITNNSTYTFYPNGSTSTWLYCTNTNNGVRVGTNNNKLFSLTDNYLFNTATSRYVGVYSGDTIDWRCYTSINNNITGETFKFYKYVSAPDTRDPAPISWNPTSGTATMSANGTTTNLPSLTNGEHLVVTYASSNPEVATIASDGTVTIVSDGETEISATYDGSDSNAPYKTTTVSYTLTVTDNRETVATPSFSTTGAVTSGTEVTISCSTSGATIYYTTGSSDFSAGDWTVYSGPIAITTACTLKAIATKTNYKNSQVAVATYSISGGSISHSVTIAEYAAANSWDDATQYTSVTIDENVTATAQGGGNTGKYYKNGNNWRFYQNESAELIINAGEYTISSVTITYASNNGGVLKYGNTTVQSGSAINNINSSTISLSVGNSGTATNGQVRITAISVTYH
jgi:hypothetical protein